MIQVLETYEDIVLLCTHLKPEIRRLYENQIEVEDDTMFYFHPTGIYPSASILGYSLTDYPENEKQGVVYLLEKFTRLIEEEKIVGCLGPISKMIQDGKMILALPVIVNEDYIEEFLDSGLVDVKEFFREVL